MEVHQHPISTAGADGDYHSLGVHATSQSNSRPSASTARSSESTSRSKLSSTASHRGSHESKPRLSKDQHERLEREFRNNRKPSTAVKKQFSQQLGISLEKVNNWFQNRRAKVKHEEKKHRNNIPSWSTELPSGVPLSEHEFLNSAFLQIQDPSHVSQAAYFPHGSQSKYSLDPALPFGNPTTVGDCPTIHEEPRAPDDSNALMSFMGIDTQDGRNLELQDVSHISEQFNPHPAAGDAFAHRPQYPPSFASSAQTSDVTHHGHNVSGSSLPQHHVEDTTQNYPPYPDEPRGSLSLATSMAGMHAEPSPYGQPWMINEPSTSMPQTQSANFGIEDAREMVNQLQARASQGEQFFTGQQAFAHPTAQTNMAVPQPILPSHPPSFDASQFHNYHDGQASAGHQDLEDQSASEEIRALSRTDSGTSMLAEHMGGVNIDSNSANAMRPPSITPSLSFAQRRQKRPANISAAASRSLSSNQAPLSASDRAQYASNSADAHLRRIKSSSGVLNGRVQKPSGQRSPLYQSHFAESHPHITRQMSTSSLNAALLTDENARSSQPPPLPQPPQSANLHIPQASNSSGLTHLTIPEDASQTPESIWSHMPSTADTTNTSLYYSVPQTAHTAKSYMSPPDTPMSSAQIHNMQLQTPSMQLPFAGNFQSHWQHSQQQQPQLESDQFHSPETVSPHQHVQHHPVAEPMDFTTDDLVMSSIPLGQAPPGHPPGSAQMQMPMGPPPQDHFVQHPMRHHVQPTEAHQMMQLQDPRHQQPIMMVPVQHQHHQSNMHQHEMLQQPQHHQFVWNLEPGPQQTDQRQQALQIHQFTPSNPVDPSNMPPKQLKASPRQTYSFQNVGPDYYSSPKSQSSQSKTSSPVPLQISG